MLCILWDMETEEVEDILQEFVNKSLLFCDRNGKSFHYYLHDLQLDFLTEKNRNQLQVQFWLTYLPLTLFSQSWAFRKCSFVKQNLFLWPASYTSFDAARNMVSGLQEHIVKFFIHEYPKPFSGAILSTCCLACVQANLREDSKHVVSLSKMFLSGEGVFHW